MTGRNGCWGCVGLALALLPAAGRADLKIEEKLTSLESTITRWTMVQGVKRAIVTRSEPTGVLYNAGAHYGARVEIHRPDKELIWDLEPAERSYREIKAPEFMRLLQKGVQVPRDSNEQPLRGLYASQTTAIEVVPTGDTRRIAGFTAEKVMARAVVGARNQISGNQFRFTFDQELWLTKDPRIMSELGACDEAFAEAFGAAVSLAQAQSVGGEWSDAFITHVRALGDRVRALQGYPLSMLTTVTEEAVAQNKGEKGSSRKLVVAQSEVKRISLETLPATEFELPAGYINADTRVAVAGPAAPAPAAATPPPAAPPATTPAPRGPNLDAGAGGSRVASATGQSPATGSTATAGPVVAATPMPVPSAPVPTGPTRPAVSAPTQPIAVVTAPPTNVLVPGANAPATPRKGKKPPATPVIVGGAGTGGSLPLIFGSLATTQAIPQAVVVDEPEELKKHTKRKK